MAYGYEDEYDQYYDGAYGPSPGSGIITNNPPPGYEWRGPTGWVAPGVVQPLRSIDEGGQPPPPQTTGTPGPATTTTTDGGGNDFGGGFEGGTFDWPGFNPPSFDPGAPFEGPAPFTFDAFSAPSLQDAQNEPGYEFARKEGQRALENSAAGRGVLRTGGTLKDLIGWGNRFAEQNYGNVYNRAANTYTTNRNNAADNYKTNFGVSKDVFDTNYGMRVDKFDRDYKGAYDSFQPVQRQAELTFDDLYRRWKSELDATTSIATAGAGL